MQGALLKFYSILKILQIITLKASKAMKLTLQCENLTRMGYVGRVS